MFFLIYIDQPPQAIRFPRRHHNQTPPSFHPMHLRTHPHPLNNDARQCRHQVCRR